MQTPEPLHRFREILYTHFTNRADTTLALLDTLCTDHRARSVAELSLSPVFTRGHDSLYKVIAECHLPEAAWRSLRSVLLPTLIRPGRLWVWSLDVTGHPRPYARTLEDRQMIYQPTPIAGNRPVSIGHRYSLVFAHPPRRPGEPVWAPPLAVKRVSSDQDPEVEGAKQVLALVKEGRAQGWLQPQDRVVILGDSKYSKPAVVQALADEPQVVLITRLRRNRVFYRRLEPPPAPRPRGRPRVYGERLALAEEQPALAPDEQVCVAAEDGQGCWEIALWHRMVARGQARWPVTLARVRLLDAQGQPRHARPLWLQVSGQGREALRPEEPLLYHQRFDGEHTLRFFKQRLLVTRFLTPQAEREAHWWQLAQLAYLQLWLAREHLPGGRYPWQKGLPERPLGPGDVQRGWGGFFARLAVQPRPVKRRGKSPGWPKGRRRTPRPPRKVVRPARPKG